MENIINRNVITQEVFDLSHVGHLGIHSCSAAGRGKVLEMRAIGGGEE